MDTGGDEGFQQGVFHSDRRPAGRRDAGDHSHRMGEDDEDDGDASDEVVAGVLGFHGDKNTDYIRKLTHI